MYYANGGDLEESIFGTRGGSFETVNALWGKGRSFNVDISSLIDGNNTFFPDTRLGEVLYRQIVRSLEKNNVSAEGLFFISSVDTRADYHHYTDGFLYSRLFYPYVVTIDVFNIASDDLGILRDFWFDSFEGEEYTDSHFQSDLYSYKKGCKEWLKKNRGFHPSQFRPTVIDFRRFATSQRPENHFILTPSDVATYEGRRSFAKLITGYFKKVSDQKKAEIKP